MTACIKLRTDVATIKNLMMSFDDLMIDFELFIETLRNSIIGDSHRAFQLFLAIFLNLSPFSLAPVYFWHLKRPFHSTITK